MAKPLNSCLDCGKEIPISATYQFCKKCRTEKSDAIAFDTAWILVKDNHFVEDRCWLCWRIFEKYGNWPRPGWSRNCECDRNDRPGWARGGVGP